MQYQRYLWLVPLLLFGSSAISPAQADNGQLKRGGLSVTAAPGIGALDVDFTITQTSLLSTYTSGPPTPPGSDTTFDGTIDFDTADGTPGEVLGVPLKVVNQQQIQKRGNQFVFAVSQRGVVSHTYPVAGTYTATFENCCQGVFKLTSSKSTLSFYTDDPPDDVIKKTVVVNVGAPGCQEQTLFAQLDCLLDKLNTAVDNAGITKELTLEKLHNQLNFTKGKKDEAEAACGVGDATKATTEMNKASGKMRDFLVFVKNHGQIDDGAEADFIAQGTAIKDIIDGLIAAGVCTGSACLPDPPRRAIQCEVDQLLDAIAAQATDAQIAEKLARKLDRISQILEQLDANCEVDNLKKATGNVKKMRTTVKNIMSQVSKLEKRGKIPASLIAALRAGGDFVTARLDDLSANGVCQ
jgi:hypothetical protein